MSDCELCDQGDPSITTRCWRCRELFHIHQSQVDMTSEGQILMADCPGCPAINCWQMRDGKVDYSGPIIYSGQPIVDLRKKRGLK